VLHVRRFGSGPPLVALHGFTLTGAQFASASLQLRRTIHAPDLPGHGFSAAESTELSDTVSAVGSVVHAFNSDAPLLGYSMGARIALLVAVERPASVPSLIIVSGTPGIEDTTQRNERIVSDTALSRSIRDRPVEEFLDTWTSSGITDLSHLPDAVRTHDRIVRKQSTSAGLAGALVGLGQGVQPSMWNRLDQLTMPVLLIHGEHDATYAAIADRMDESIPNSRTASIAGSGHNPLLDAPEETYREISAFLERLGRPGRPVVETLT